MGDRSDKARYISEVIEDESEEEKKVREEAELKAKEAKLAKAKAEAAKIAAEIAAKAAIAKNTPPVNTKPKQITRAEKYKKMWGTEFKGRGGSDLVDE